jgi:hypothetical protein
MSPASLKEQLQQIDPEKIYDAYDPRAGGALILMKGQKNFYNGIDSVKVMDKSGKEVMRKVTGRTAVRLTHADGRRAQLYFDSLFIRDSLIYGSKSHLLTLPVRPFNVDSLAKIDLQVN